MFIRLEDVVDDGTVELPVRLIDTKFLTAFDLATTLFLIITFLWSLRHGIRAALRAEKADIEQTQKVVPFITCEVPFGQNVRELILGVNIPDLDFGF